MQYIIDVESHDTKQLIRRLDRLSWVEDVQDGGQYRQDTGYSQVLISTTKTEDEIDQWLYKYSNVDYVAVVPSNQ